MVEFEGTANWDGLITAQTVAPLPLALFRVLPYETQPLSGVPTLEAQASGCTLAGTDDDDLIIGTPKPDVLCGDSGNDVIRAGAGNDVVLGEGGSDVVDGGPGADEQSDSVEGGAGRASARSSSATFRRNSRSPWRSSFPDRHGQRGRRVGRVHDGARAQPAGVGGLVTASPINVGRRTNVALLRGQLLLGRH